uniref:Dirigent protein n=1 Tax=Oryza brachyantha TaxID=4533 RepID=J3N1U3_ORYBR
MRLPPWSAHSRETSSTCTCTCARLMLAQTVTTKPLILNPKVRPNDFGVTAAAATISESLDPNAKVVARAEGFHMQTSYSGTSWYASFNIVFEDDRFKGSMLQVMGTTPAEGQWAMCSGTGEFALAHGIIKQKVIQSSPGENVKELHIHAFYTPMNNTVVPGATDGKSWTLGA